MAHSPKRVGAIQIEAMGRHIMQKTGNVAAVQRQLGHKNAAYSLSSASFSRSLRRYRNGGVIHT